MKRGESRKLWKQREAQLRAILRHREKAARVKVCKIMDFLLIIPPLLRLNYSLPELTGQPHTQRPLHPIKPLDLLTLHLFPNHDMTFQVCQV